MKKIISLFVLCAMLMCAALATAVSAAGDVLWTERFDTEDPNNWLWDGTAFYVEDGVLKGWDEAKVHQSNFPTSTGGTRKYKECAIKIDCIAYDDGGADAEYHRLGLWWADYIDPYATDDPTSWLVYKPLYNFEQHTLELEMEFAGDEGETFRPAGLADDSVVLRKEIPESSAPKMGEWFSIGMRVNAGVVSFFLNDEKVADFTAYRGTLTGSQRPSPVILLNGGCYCGFDNLVVSTPDYNLFNESAAPVNNDPVNNEPVNNDPEETETRIDTVIVTDTDEEGNVVTRVETEKTVVPAPNTGNNGGGGRTATKTGDAAVIVLAVMVAAIGTALVVKKVCVK